MTSGKKSVTISGSGKTSFGTVVDEACKKLMDQQTRYSIRRIEEMDKCLAELERELDEFLFNKQESL